MLDKAKLVAFAATTDLAGARAFYEGILGLAVVDDNPMAVVFDANGTVLRVTLVGELTTPPYTVLGWEVADIGAAIDNLAADGIEFLRFAGMDQDEQGAWTAPGGDLIAWFEDPDGNILSLAQPARSPAPG